ncbi:MAG: hypothetical protein ACREXR_07700 [Gammaproteobacteria bacterium]
MKQTVGMPKERESKFWDEQSTVYNHARVSYDHNNVRLLAIDNIKRRT